MKENKINSIIYLIACVLLFYTLRDAFFVRLLTFSGREVKIENYSFLYEEGKPKISFSYYNDFKRKSYEVVQNLNYESVKNELESKKNLVIRYNEYYPEFPYILGSPIYVSLFFTDS